jgi:glycine cleavage system H protein
MCHTRINIVNTTTHNISIMYISFPHAIYTQHKEARNMAKWKAVRVKQELMEQVKREVERSEYRGLSDFVSDAIKQRLQTLTKQRVTHYLERDQIARSPQLQGQVLFTPHHVWAKMTPEGTVEVGISNYFQDQLKEIVNIRTETIGEAVSKDQTFGAAESWWFTYDLYSPINGVIVAVNDEVIENPFILNVDPSVWVVKIQPTPAETQSWMKTLLDATTYQKLVNQAPAQPAGHL